MTENFIRVVDNKFQELSNAGSVLSFDELVAYFRTDQPAAEISLEQGISELQVDLLRKSVAEWGLSEHRDGCYMGVIHGEPPILFRPHTRRNCVASLPP